MKGQEILRLTPDNRLVLEETSLPPQLRRGEKPARPLQALISPEVVASGPRAPWPALHFYARTTQTDATTPDTLVHAPGSCGEVMRHAGRTLGTATVPVGPGEAEPPPRGMKYPCLAPLIYSALKAVERASGRVLLLSRDTPTARLMAHLLGENTRVYPPPRRPLGRAQGISPEQLPGTRWDTVIAWAAEPGLVEETLASISFHALLASPLIACLLRLPLVGKLPGNVEIIWPRGLGSEHGAILEAYEMMKKHSRVLRIAPSDLPLDLSSVGPGVFIVVDFGE